MDAADPIGNAGADRAFLPRLRDFGRRHRVLITVVGSVATAAVLVLLLAGRREEFTAALSDAAPGSSRDRAVRSSRSSRAARRGT